MAQLCHPACTSVEAASDTACDGCPLHETAATACNAHPTSQNISPATFQPIETRQQLLPNKLCETPCGDIGPQLVAPIAAAESVFIGTTRAPQWRVHQLEGRSQWWGGCGGGVDTGWLRPTAAQTMTCREMKRSATTPCQVAMGWSHWAAGGTAHAWSDLPPTTTPHTMLRVSVWRLGASAGQGSARALNLWPSCYTQRQTNQRRQRREQPHTVAAGVPWAILTTRIVATVPGPVRWHGVDEVCGEMSVSPK